MTDTSSGADLDAIWDSLEQTGVYVDPSMASKVTPQQVHEIQANMARADEPMYVVAYPLQYNDEFNGGVEDFVATLHDHNPQPGIYLAADTALGEARIGGNTWDTATDGYTVFRAGYAARYEEPDNIGDQLVAATRMLADGTVQKEYAEYEKAADKQRESTQSTSYPSDDNGSGTVVGVSLAVAVTAVLVAGALVWRRMTSDRAPRAGKAFTLPSSVIDRVRDAHDSALVERADRELLALGELIDETDMSGDTAAWQAALDHYDAAKRARGDSLRPDVLDVVGALVLVERGSAALAAATAGKAYEPQATCYLNPLHGRATGRTRLDTESGKVDVPLCAQCRRDLKAQRRPDILDVVRGGKPVHYFDSQVEPWASTGYGALEPDLVTQLQRTRR